MKRRLDVEMPTPVSSALRKFGSHIRIARLKRGLTSAAVAAKVGVHRTTYTKIENGDPAVSVGLYASALFAMDLGLPLANVADPLNDRTGLLLDLKYLPKRARQAGTRSRHQIEQPAVHSIRDRSRIFKVGIVATMSGPFALWGSVCKFAALATAELYNRSGGVEVGSERYHIEIVVVDDALEPEQAAAGVEQLVREEGIRYIIGPNVEQTFVAAAAVAERVGAMLFPYSFTRACYSLPFENAVLGQVPGFQAWPHIYKYLRDERGVRSIGVVAPNSPEGQMQRRETVAAASQLGLNVYISPVGYNTGSGCSKDTLELVMDHKPDLIVLPNLAPVDAPKLIITSRELGFSGFFATEAAQEIGALTQRTGGAADGFITLGGASSPVGRSQYMDAFMGRYCEIAGGWHDEAGTKAYALEMILGTLRTAGPAAIDDIAVFKLQIPGFAMRDPFVHAEEKLEFVGSGYFGQKRQIGVPLVVNLVRNSRFEPVMITRLS